MTSTPVRFANAADAEEGASAPGDVRLGRRVYQQGRGGLAHEGVELVGDHGVVLAVVVVVEVLDRLRGGVGGGWRGEER